MCSYTVIYAEKNVLDIVMLRLASIQIIYMFQVKKKKILI